MVYAATPMVMSRMVTDDERAAYFGYLTGTQQVGIGVGPVGSPVSWSRRLWDSGGTFLVAGVVCLVAVALTLVVGMLVSDAGADARNGDGRKRVLHGLIRRGDAAYFGIRGRLLACDDPAFACLFTTMTSFQPTFAGERGLDYSVFYVAYTVAVIFSRFVLAGMAARASIRGS